MKAFGKDGIVRYVVTLIVTLFLLAIIVVYTFHSFYILAKEDTITMGETAAKERAKALENLLLQGMDTLDVSVQSVEYLMERGISTQQIEEFLLMESTNYAERLKEEFNGIYGVIEGEYVDGSGWIPDANYVPSERDWYIKAVEDSNGKIVLVPPYIDAQTGTVIVSVTQSFGDGENVLALDIGISSIQELMDNISLNNNGYGFIMDDTGLVVAHTDKAQQGANYLTDEIYAGSDMQKLAGEVLNGKNATIELDISGEKYTIFSAAVQEGWNVVLVINSEDLFLRVRTVLFQNICISLLVFGMVAYFCTSSYFHRVKAIHYAQELEEYQRTLVERVAEQTEEIKKQTAEILAMQEDVIEGMATLIESRDGNTGEHVRNTKKYVALIVNDMLQQDDYCDEVTEEYAEKLINAAALHDIGKITISDTILNKPGKLTAEEFEIMKRHSSSGSQIVKSILGEHADGEFLKIAQDVAQYHHERWDGTGYPEGLKEKEIPLASRIMAVADVFDALVSKRVYKDKMPVEQAFRILEEEAGHHFDPAIIEIFLKHRGEIKSFLTE